jgi:hypothetical protein
MKFRWNWQFCEAIFPEEKTIYNRGNPAPEWLQGLFH